MVSDLPLRDPEVYRLARELDRLRRQIHDVEVASQGAHRSVEDGAIDVYDDNDVLRERIGRQADGTFSRKSFAGDPPPAPTDPDVQVIGDGVVAVTWDGRFEEKYLTGEFRAVQVHLGDDPAFVCSRNTMEGALFTRWGGTVVVVTESDDDNPVYVKLRAINRAGVVGAESAAVLVDEDDDLSLEDDEELQWEADDAYALTAADVTAGSATIQLSHLPEVESVTAKWGQLAQEPTEYTVDYDTGIVTWPLAGFEAEGDRLWFHYAYQDGAIDNGIQTFLEVPNSDAVDRSAVAYDDSGWATAMAPFSSRDGLDANWPQTWTTRSSPWNGNSTMWTRKHFPRNASGYRIVVRVDNEAWLYWNGAQVGHGNNQFYTEFTVDITPAQLLDDNVLAVKAADYGAPSYLDIIVTGL